MNLARKHINSITFLHHFTLGQFRYFFERLWSDYVKLYVSGGSLSVNHSKSNSNKTWGYFSTDHSQANCLDYDSMLEKGLHEPCRSPYGTFWDIFC
jgi:hypothetical protein